MANLLVVFAKVRTRAARCHQTVPLSLFLAPFLPYLIHTVGAKDLSFCISARCTHRHRRRKNKAETVYQTGAMGVSESKMIEMALCESVIV